MKKLVTTIQITFEITHDEDLDPLDVAHIAASTACDAIVWTDHTRLSRATDGVETPVRTIVSAVVGSRSYEEGSS